jgi:tRNA threonylcarbamoyladenosine biosynthesis protein TsaB
MTILNIETSTSVCSIAISNNGKCIFKKSNFEGMNHAALLSGFVAESLEMLKKESITLDAIAISSGPGSYTGLRIGTSTAKGLCFGLDIPLISLSTLEIMTTDAVLKVNNDEYIFCPMIDARRMEVYTALYDIKLNTLQDINAKIIDNKSFNEYLETGKLCFFGNGADKCKDIITHPNALFIDQIHPLAENMIVLAEKAYRNDNFVNLTYYEPFYLKEFYTTATQLNFN